MSKPSAKSGAKGRLDRDPRIVAKEQKVPGRVQNAKSLRKGFADVRNSLDGTDPDPLTVPKCVECSHCGWPVWPRDSKVATSKTYARAGIERGKSKAGGKAGEGGADGAGGEGEGEEGGSNDSRDTVEKLEDSLEELQEKYDMLQAEKQELLEENTYLTDALEKTTAELKEAREKIEFLEESEERWRDKNSVLRLENQRLLWVIECKSTRSEDLETALKVSILDAQNLRRIIARMKRRRGLMLDKISDRDGARNASEMRAALFGVWRDSCTRSRLNRKVEEVEARRQREVFELRQSLNDEQDRVETLRGKALILERKLKAAAKRVLLRSLSSSAHPWAAAHAVRAWMGVTPVVSLERQLKDTKEVLAVTAQKLEREEALTASLTAERDQLSAEATRLSSELESASKELGLLREQVDANSANSIAERLAREKALEEERKRLLAEMQARIDALEREFEEEREAFEAEKRQLDAKIRQLELAASGNGGGTGGLEDDSHRIVPKGQGVLCVGCLKQILNRGVQPLPPLERGKVKGEPPHHMDKARKMFFQKELDGVANPDDEVHKAMFKAMRDPYGTTRHTLYPPTEDTAPSPPSKGLPMLSPSATTKAVGWPRVDSPGSTSMPALWKDVPRKEHVFRASKGFQRSFR